MKIKERFIWISITVILLLFFSVFILFVKDARAANFKESIPYFEKLSYVYSIIKSDYVEENVNDEKLMDGAIKGMIDSLGDEHSMYLSDEFMKLMNQTSTGKYGGIGLVISQKDNNIVVISPIEGSPAYKKGIKAGDYILSVNGESLKGLNTDVAADKLRGEPGTTVKIEVLSNDIKFEVELIRQLINLPTVKYDYINNKYGYLRILEFSGTTDKFVKEALLDFKKKNIKGMIVDLRDDPGGLLEQVIKIVNYFQYEGLIVSTKGRNFSTEAKANILDAIVDKNIPIIVLVNKGSASASEIFAGALKDTRRAILIGEKTFGKGSVQTVYPFNSVSQSSKDGFKLTIAKFYTPSNNVIDKKGIEPNIEVKEPELTDVEKDSLKKLLNDKVIDKFVKDKPKATDKEIDDFIITLKNEGYKLSNRNLKKLIKNSLDLTDDKKSIYDLEYDLQLQKALEVLNKGLIKKNDKGFYLEK